MTVSGWNPFYTPGNSNYGKPVEQQAASQGKKNKRRKKRRGTPVWTRFDYRKYIKSKAWRNLRKVVLERDKYACQKCLATGKPLHVHHLNYNRVGREKLTDLISVCEDCHGLEHENKYLPMDDLSVEYRGIIRNS